MTIPLTYSRQLLLQYRGLCATPAPSPALPQLSQTTPPTQSRHRSGRRRKIFLENCKPSFLTGKPRGIREFKHTISSRAPPPRGTPGSLTQGNEECTPTRERAKARSRGAKRRLRRREYRAWCGHCAKDRGLRVGPRPLAGPRLKKAAQSRATWFKQAISWQRQLKRKRSHHWVNFPTTPLLAYGQCLRFACVNVQGFAETLIS